MKNLIKLVKINLLTFFDIHKIINIKKFKDLKKVLPMMLLYIYAFGALSFFVYYGASFALKGLILMKIEYLLPVAIMALSSAYLTFTTIFKVNKTIFDAKDYSFLLSLPIKKTTIIASKLFVLYFSNLIYLTIFMIPTYIAYILKVDVTLMFHLLFWLTFFLIPLVPTVIGSIIGSLFTAFISRFKYKNVVNIIINFLFIFMVYYITNKAQSMTAENLANLSNVIVDKFQKIYPLTKMYLEIIKNNSIINLLTYIVLSVGLFQLFNYLVVSFFDNINSKLNAVSIIRKYDDKKTKMNKPLYSLYKINLKRYFSSSIYVLNTMVGCVLLLIALGFLAFSTPEALNQILQIPDFSNYFISYAPLVFGASSALSCTTNASISLEGKNLWILKVIPININQIFIAKILVNLTIILPTILIGTILLSFVVHISILEFIILLFTPTIYALFIAGLGLLINLYFPDFNWTNEVKVVKQSIASFVSIAVGMAIAIIPLFIKNNLNHNLYSFLVGLVMLLLSLLLYYILFNKGKNIFKSL